MCLSPLSPRRPTLSSRKLRSPARLVGAHGLRPGHDLCLKGAYNAPLQGKSTAYALGLKPNCSVLRAYPRTTASVIIAGGKI